MSTPAPTPDRHALESRIQQLEGTLAAYRKQLELQTKAEELRAQIAVLQTALKEAEVQTPLVKDLDEALASPSEPDALHKCPACGACYRPSFAECPSCKTPNLRAVEVSAAPAQATALPSVPVDDPVVRKRPRSLTAIAVIALALYGFGYAGAAIMLSGANDSESLTWARLFAEPPEPDGGIPWPGWEGLRAGLRIDPASFVKAEGAPRSPSNHNDTNYASLLDLIDTDVITQNVAARYWWAKINLIGGLLIAGPLLILGWLGMFLGRAWGRLALYVYLAVWLPDKLAGAYMLPEPEGGIRFVVCAAMACVLLFLLNRISWRRWTDPGRSFPSLPAVS